MNDFNRILKMNFFKLEFFHCKHLVLMHGTLQSDISELDNIKSVKSQRPSTDQMQCLLTNQNNRMKI